ncbi:MAG: GNAT family N-acetyltransferase, partial [Owenweeksia sp.]|nr:GNAT family N-acetyltransferase [Owenweeksia sp.]HCQ14846.1 GNAT family N-acetyltransferase [Cryomorphaceae bacterium]
MRISIREFKQLSTIELYDILALRTRIFVVEQKCAYQEVDYHDQHS